MKVVVCQGEPIGGAPDREALIKVWKEELRSIDTIDEIVIRERFDYGKIDEILEGTDILLGAWIIDGFFNTSFFEKYPKLKYIASFAHGFGKIDEKAARKHQVTFTNTIYGDITIAQFTMALLLEICHKVSLQADYYKKRLNDAKPIKMGTHIRTLGRQIELYEKTIGIIGLGNIGFRVAQMASGFGMHVVAYSKTKKTGKKFDFIEQVSYEELLERSDVVSIHCPLTDSTRGMINKEAINQMKDGVILLNTARGAIINEADLVESLKSGKVYAAGLDVVENEPLQACNALMELDNTVITPHIAWAPEEARYRTISVAIDNLKNWLNGKPTSVIV